MAYATVQDLVDAFGADELARASTPDGADLAGVQPERPTLKLEEASALMDSYLRRRYAVPLPASPALRACCCALARYALGFGSNTVPTEQARLARKEAIKWLEDIAAGDVTLDGAGTEGSASAAPIARARVQDRPASIQSGGPLGW